MGEMLADVGKTFRNPLALALQSVSVCLSTIGYGRGQVSRLLGLTTDRRRGERRRGLTDASNLWARYGRNRRTIERRRGPS